MELLTIHAINISKNMYNYVGFVGRSVRNGFVGIYAIHQIPDARYPSLFRDVD